MVCFIIIDYSQSATPLRTNGDNVVTRSTLELLFNPRSIALIGASDKSTFAKLIVGNLRDAGLGDRVFLVNPRSAEVLGQRAYPSCDEIGQPIDLAYLMVPADAIPEAIRSAHAAGAHAAVILSSGFAEAGDEGKSRQAELVQLADELDIAILGPNVLGFINVVDAIPAMALSDPPKRPGSVALISQSGASCGAMKDFAEMSAIDLSHIVTVGNEAVLSIADIAGYLVEDDRVRALAIFMESIKDPAEFARVARRAAERGKPIVVLKAGRSELAARSAASHTGALVGDDAVVDAVLQELAVIRVDTIEDMLVTAGLGAVTGVLPEGGLAVASISGGACDIVADLADQAGLSLPELAAETVERLTAALPTFGHAQNPLDVTGAALGQPGLWWESITALGADPAVAAVAVVNSLPWREDGRVFYGQTYVDEIGSALSSLAKPGVYVTQVMQPIGVQTREILHTARVGHTIAGLRGAVHAFAALSRWSESLRSAPVSAPAAQAPSLAAPEKGGALSEAQSRELLSANGVPFVPVVVASTPGEAGRAPEHWGGGLSAVKIVSADILHKSDIGGVRLNVAAADVAEVAADILRTCARNAPSAKLDGVLVSPMRSSETELIVGVTRDSDWGLILAVGLGGVFVEALNDVVLARVPVSEERAETMLRSLRGSALLEGARGRQPADIRAVARVIAAISQAAQGLGDRLEALEVNPLRVAGSEIEALDALVILTN